MKRLFIAFISLLLVIGFSTNIFAAKPESIPARIGVVQCGETVTIYENHTNQYVIVNVIVSDYCSEIDSKITAYRSTTNSTEIIIPDGNTVCSSFVIGREVDEGKIVLECNGNDGYCMYALRIYIPDVIY